MPKGVRIKRDKPQIGSKFERGWKGMTYMMTVVKKNDSIKYKVDNNFFDSPSAAAQSITKQATNGWQFWKIEKRKIEKK